MSAIPTTFISAKEYLEEERKALNKSEYYREEIFAMAGATYPIGQPPLAEK